MKLLVSEILDYLHGLGPMYNSPKVEEILAINDDHSYYIVLKDILDRSLSEFELKVPLFMLDRSMYSPSNGAMVEFKDNYDAYLEGRITEQYIELVPTSILHYTDGLLRSYRDFTYVCPYVRMPRKGSFKISYHAKYPKRFKKDEKTQGFTVDSHIYGLSKDYSGPDFTYFMYIVEYNILVYLREQKAQMTYSDLPIEFYANLDQRVQEILQDLQDWYSNPIWYGKLFI